MDNSEKLENSSVETSRRIIREILSELKMTAPKFAAALGIGYMRIFDLMRGRTKKFNPGIVNIICEKFPQFNPSYLYTGEGSLLREGYTSSSETADQQEQATHATPIPVVEVAAPVVDAASSQLLSQVVGMLHQLNERSAELYKRERELNEREAYLNQREFEVMQREASLGFAQTNPA